MDSRIRGNDACARLAILLLLMALATVRVFAQAPAVVLKPLPGGPISIALVCPRFAALDAEALATRVDVQLRTAFTDEDPTVLLAKKPPRVLVLANVDLAAMPEGFAAQVRSFVEGGGGLAMAYARVPEEGPWRDVVNALAPLEEAPTFSRGVPAAFAPDGTDLAGAAMPHTLGQGRVVVMEYPGDVPQYHALFPPAAPGIAPDIHHTDHACMLWARMLLWLAQREVGQRIDSIENVSPDGPNESETPPDLPQEFVESMRDTVVAQLLRPFAIELDSPADTAYEVDLQVRPIFQAGPGYHTHSAMAKGSPLIVPQLLCGSGVFYVDALLLHKKEVVDFYSQQVTIENWPVLESLRADKTFLQANDTLTIEAQVRPVYSVHRSATVYAQALDSYGRLVAQAWQPITHSGGRVLLALTFADLIAPLVEVRVIALEGEPRTVTPWDLYAGAVDTLRFPVKFAKRDAGMHWVAAMPALAEENAAQYLENLAGMGVDHVVAGGGLPSLVAAARVPVLLAPMMGEDPADPPQEGSLTDGAYGAREDERLREEKLDYLAGASGAYVLHYPSLMQGEEGDLAEFLAQRRSALVTGTTGMEVGVMGGGAALAEGLDFVSPQWDPVEFLLLESQKPGAALSGMAVGPEWTPEQFALAPWLMAVGGMQSVWTPEPVSDGGLMDQEGNPTEAAAALSQAAAMCNARLHPLLANAGAPPREVVLLHAGERQEETLRWARALMGAGHWPVLEGKAFDSAKTRAVCWPDGVTPDEEALSSLKSFVQGGGKVLAEGAACEACTQAVGAEAVVCMEEGTLEERIGAVLEEMGVASPLPLDKDKTGGIDTLVRRFTYGKANVVLSVPWPDGPVEKPKGPALVFEGKGQHYRPLGDTRRGGGKRVTLEGKTVDCAVWLPYEVKDMTLEAGEQVIAGTRAGFAITLQADTIDIGRHCVEVTLSPPMGEPIAGGRKVFTCERGALRAYIPVPLNAIPGDYMLRARDLLTGLEDTAMVEVVQVAGPGFHALH